MTATEAMERATGKEAKDVKPEASTTTASKLKDHHASASGADNTHHQTPKKRRKVSHACLYCRRSHMTCDLERPCTRCVKRNIGHLCHDEPRDQASVKSKSTVGPSAVHGSTSGSQSDLGHGKLNRSAESMRLPSFDSNLTAGTGQAANAAFDAALGQGSQLQLVQPTAVSGVQANALSSSMSQFAGFSDAWLASNHFHDMNFHQGFVIAPEVTNEFNLLNDFVQTSLFDENAPAADDQAGQIPAFPNSNNNNTNNTTTNNNVMLPPSAASGNSMLLLNSEKGKSISRPTSTLPADKARDYYLQAADPTGNATPAERMTQVLRAKYDAGLLKPFDYIKGYTRLSTYLNGHVAPASKQKILRQLDRFRPKFREKMQGLSTWDLTLVEMKIEESLMDYDRVFASMAIPACCWRRTGEIFRGNKEMAELIKVPVEDLRGGKISLHEILTEESVVRYWEEFGTIAFDPDHETLLTACSVKSPDDNSKHVVNCCFSFRIRKDDHKIHSTRTPANLAGARASIPQTAAAAANRDKVEKKVGASMEFTKRLLALLASTPSELRATEELVAEIFEHTKKLHLCCQQKQHLGTTNDAVTEVDEVGTKLWNLCTRLRRDTLTATNLLSSDINGDGEQQQQGQKRLRRLYLFGRALAFWLLGIARGGRGRGEVVGVMKLGLKVVRDCIEEKETELAGMVLQLVADYKGMLQNMQGFEGLSQEEAAEGSCLEMEYFILRTALAWLENRLDIAEHMYAKTELLRHFLTRDFAEKLADVLFEIGKSLYVKGDNAIAVKWLDRANDVINGQELEQLSREGIELRLAILQASVTAHLGSGTEEGLVKAKNAVDFLEGEMGNKLVVSLLKLEILQNTPAEVFDEEAYAEVLRHIIRNFNFSDSEFKLIMHHIRKLHDKSPATGGGILDDFIIVLRGPDKVHWMEKAIITRVWMITNQRDSAETITSINGVLGHLHKALSPEAAVAAQALLWKKIESNYSQGQHDLAENWCHLALHQIFQNCGPLNIAKIERKLLLCALARNNMDGAISVLQGMSASSWQEPMTAYLAFKIATRTENQELAEKCLLTISQTPDHVEFLGACIAESQKAGDITCALAALKMLLEKYEHKEPNPIHLPALFRCTIRLLNLTAARSGVEGNEAGDLCEAFEKVLYSIMRKLVNEIWALESFDAIKLAKYTRCLFQATLPLDDELAIRLLDEASIKAKELREGKANWPEDELEWMAATAFNHAIDCYSANDIERSRAWANGAIHLAGFCEDSRLEEVLKIKYERLGMDHQSSDM
ncbi:meiosis protein SPO22/ZIP4 like-domain-containing protein [Podospora fimiseda]|uniref:Meiosis protein SPO22/ZIP4 like-domain-containing protein n=1 Tax=Podospora fimiseda TaxID=252190 RepID=A0AAN7BEX4_9PEZI|nr:meiosis protein SPO22/ZIP4 like-domain-containing protein [Podospora fimiseda]